MISANRSYREIFGPTREKNRSIRCHESRPGPKCHTHECPLYQINSGGMTRYTCESVKKEKDGSRQYFVVTATPYYDIENNPVGIIDTFQDIPPQDPGN